MKRYLFIVTLIVLASIIFFLKYRGTKSDSEALESPLAIHGEGANTTQERKLENRPTKLQEPAPQNSFQIAVQPKSPTNGEVDMTVQHQAKTRLSDA